MQKTDQTITSPFGEPSVSVWTSTTHCAAAFEEKGVLRLSIARQDLSDGMSWEELSRVKADCGFGDRDAIELYPAEGDVINTGPIRHLYILTEQHPLVKRGLR